MQLRIKEILPALEKMIPAKKNVLLTGSAGCGKTSIVKQVAEKLGYHLIIDHPVICDSTDFKGLPAIVEGRAEFLPYNNLMKLIDAEEPTIYFIDDMGQAPQSVQAALMQILLAREIGGKKISDEVRFVGATNRRQDRAAVSGILQPVIDRFAAIFEMVVNAEDWINWAYNNNVPDDLIAYINYRPSSLVCEEYSLDIQKVASPRSVAAVGDMLKLGLDSFEYLSATIGEGFATEFLGFRQIFKDLPDIDIVLKDPENAPIFTDPAKMYALAGAMIARSTKENQENIVKYSLRVQKDFAVMIVKTLLQKDDSVMETPSFNKWAQEFRTSLYAY
jgi:MoxR-like ATPase